MALFLFFFSLFPAWLAVRGGAEHGDDGECPGGAGCAGGERSPACPAGFFCPPGNGSVPVPVPVPCPPGTFGPAGAAGPSPGCQPCPAGSFSPRPGQSSCLPCGSGAAQPAEGQSTCVCPGPAQVYQPRDGLCTCPPGFRSSGRDGDGCTRRSYPVCRDSASRTPEGHCLTPRGWARYCSQKVCAAPEDFRGYDRVLGLCRCRSDSLESVWSSGCREQRESRLQLLCAGRAPRLLLTHSNGTQSAVALEGLRKVLPSPNFSLEDVCAAGQRIHPVHVVEMSGKGFLGVYNPDPELIWDLLGQGETSAPQEGNPPPAAAPGPPGPEEQPRSPKCPAQGPARGILNPLACGSGALSLLFLLSPEHFPLYDLDNLFNTNAEFDWGDFRSLREEIREIPPNSTKFLLFFFHFQAPGTYVLQLSSNKHKRMLVRVLAAGLRCRPDGPFVPGSPRAALRAGLAPRELRPRPDRSALGSAVGIGMGMGILLLVLALPLLCPAPGRVPRGRPGPGPGPDPPFRRRQLRHSLERFSSRIPAVIPRRKPRHCCSAAGAASSPGREEPWEPQLDLEGFNTKLFFELLLRQSQSVTTTLGRFKEEVKVVYHGVMREISSLKKLWLKALSVPAEEEEEEEEEAKEQTPLSGSQSPRIGGSSDTPGDPRDSIPPRLIPLLQTLLQVLQEGRKSNSSPESPGPTALGQAGQLLAARTLLLHPQLAESPLQAESHNHWLMKKNQNFLHLLSSGRQSLGQKAHPGEEAANSLSPSELEDEVDALTEELLRIAEDEEQFLNSKGNEDLLSYYLEITSLEKESLVTQIKALEEEIAQGRKL